MRQTTLRRLGYIVSYKEEVNMYLSWQLACLVSFPGSLRLYADLQTVLQKFSIKLRKQGRVGRMEKEKLSAEISGRKSRTWRRHREHQRLYGLGLKVLIEELSKGDQPPPGVTWTALHCLFDAILD